MSLLRITFALALTAILTTSATAQLNSTIQLPSFGFTTVATTVSVPDRGSVQLGGINRHRSGRNQLGTPLVGRLPFFGRPFNNVAFGTEHEALNMGVSAYIHDFEAMEESLMAQATANRRQRGAVVSTPVFNRTQQIVGENPAAISVAEIRQRRLDRLQAESVAEKEHMAEMRDLWNRAKAAEAKGKISVAKVFYRMISRETTGRVHEAALARIEALSNPGPTNVAAR
jgi:Flp pilus assembly secretin CpaC